MRTVTSLAGDQPGTAVAIQRSTSSPKVPSAATPEVSSSVTKAARAFSASRRL
ncbi:MAG TPA: hypothetical protein VGR26_05280 [Acidimicrobiales bacterium]|nr:hypothetical protein [Acidimicrobiales bacterium]